MRKAIVLVVVAIFNSALLFSEDNIFEMDFSRYKEQLRQHALHQIKNYDFSKHHYLNINMSCYNFENMDFFVCPTIKLSGWDSSPKWVVPESFYSYLTFESLLDEYEFIFYDNQLQYFYGKYYLGELKVSTPPVVNLYGDNRQVNPLSYLQSHHDYPRNLIIERDDLKDLKYFKIRGVTKNIEAYEEESWETKDNVPLALYFYKQNDTLYVKIGDNFKYKYNDLIAKLREKENLSEDKDYYVNGKFDKDEYLRMRLILSYGYPADEALPYIYGNAGKTSFDLDTTPELKINLQIINKPMED